jgi:hypothetical protein
MGMGAAMGGTFWKLVLHSPLLGMLDIDLVVFLPRLNEPRLSMMFELGGKPPPPCILTSSSVPDFDL